MDLNHSTLFELADRNSSASARSMDPKTSTTNETAPTPSHSRNSSAESSVSSPSYPSVFSSRTHSRWPSSASSLNTSPDSPPVVAKSALHDLLEEPAERDEELDLTAEVDALDDFCLCDSFFCEHQRFKSVPGTPLESSLASIDHVFDTPDSVSGLPTERRSSDGSSRGVPSTRQSRRFPSLSRRWKHRKTTSSSASASVSGTRSAPLSRSPSFRNLNWANSIMSHLHSPRSDAVRRSGDGGSSFDFPYEPDVLDDPFFLDRAKDSVDLDHERSPTPLLPFLTSPLQAEEPARIEPTLPSPPIRPNSTTAFPLHSPTSNPTSPSLRSPALSPKPSTTSIRTGISLHGACIPTCTTPAFDPWALKLGHANFHITPEPYLPSAPASTESCAALRAAWERARVAFMRQAALVAEHYGLASATYALTCQKWEQVDAVWRANFDKVRADMDACESDGAAASGVGMAMGMQSPDLRPLPETQAVLQMPALHGEKFPAVDAADFVGPMVRFETFQPPAALVSPQQDSGGRKPGLLRLLTDPASFLRKSS